MYEILNVEQGTEAWKKERLRRVTSSQISALCAISPYQTASALLEEKLTGREPEVSFFKQRLFNKGHDAELAARKWIENHYKIEFPPAVVLSKLVPDLLASLDGFNRKENIIFEAKYMGAKALEEVKARKIKPHHECQVQAELLATGAEKCIYFATTDDGDSAVVEIKPDPEYAKSISEVVAKFMKSLNTVLILKNELEELKAKLMSQFNQPKLAPLKTLESGAKDPFRVKTRYV